jgi:hypothetical protein
MANLVLLFGGNTFTGHNWEINHDLSPVARRLAEYIESHKPPFPLSLEKFRQMCGSRTATPEAGDRQLRKRAAKRKISF